jgi:Peptidase M50B-like
LLRFDCGARERVNRANQLVLVVSVLIASWLGMQDVHELGHGIAARLTGARVSKVVIDPLTISRTDLAENPRPLIVVWGGPVFGALFPIAVWLAAGAARLRGAFLVRFFAGFCLVANGAYIGAGSFNRAGDGGDMLRHGAAPWHLWLFALLTVPAGFWLWNGLGPQFGLGKAAGPVSRQIAYLAFVCAVALAMIGFAVGGRD